VLRKTGRNQQDRASQLVLFAKYDSGDKIKNVKGREHTACSEKRQNAHRVIMGKPEGK